MSLGSKFTLAAACAFSSGVVYYVHYSQKKDREGLREGVIKDVQRLEMKKIQNVKDLQNQIELTEVLRKKRDQELRLQEGVKQNEKG